MARYRANRRRSRLRPGTLIPLTIATIAAGYLLYLRFTAPPGSGTVLASNSSAKSAMGPEQERAVAFGKEVKAGRRPLSATAPNTPSLSPRDEAKTHLASGRQALSRGDLLTARTELNMACRLRLDDADHDLARSELSRIGAETIFSPRMLANDPLVERYIIKPGDTLGTIAKTHKISAELLASINNIKNINHIRAGQLIKLITGPFHVAVHKSSHTMDVYLADTLVQHYKVGLGLDGSTPTGKWRVGTKLKNPTYYPPRGGAIVSADNPENPLGERWIGLVGIAGEAVGQLRYGIHGTIDPKSIGQNVSMGCIRLHNENVKALYTYLVEEHSTVTVLD